MKIRKRSRALLALLVAFVLVDSLALAAETGVQAYPTRLRASIKDKLIILTWTDSPEAKDGYVVYRSDSAFRPETFPAAARLGSIASGAQTYTDSPPDSGLYFYAVLALGPDGNPNQVFVPAKNTTPVGLSISLVPQVATPAAKAEAPAPGRSAQPGQAFVSDLAAKVKGDAILLSYKASPKSRLVLYRGTTPIIKAADLLDATLVAAFTDKDGSFADYPVPGVEYYYAILGEEDLKAGRILIASGVNSLSESAQVRAAAVSAGFAETLPSSRTPPLPYFLMENGAADGIGTSEIEGPPPARPISPETEKAIASLLAKAPKAKPAMPAANILPEELSAPSGGEDYALSIIVSDRIASKDWSGAIDQLRKYLSLNRGPKASARARFYLGEALAYTGSGRESFFELLSALKFYPLETKPWIEYVLSTLQ
jgi:hypothetical protein